MNIVEFYSGTESFSTVARSQGHRTFTVDSRKSFNPDLVKNVLHLHPHDIPFVPHVIWASPECRVFSVAAGNRHWKKEKGIYKPQSIYAVHSMDHIRKIFRIINWWMYSPLWFIENPRGILRHLPEMEALVEQHGGVRHTVHYCQYGFDVMKPTDIWTNCKTWTPRPICEVTDPCHPGSTLEVATSRKRAIVPAELCWEILDSL